MADDAAKTGRVSAGCEPSVPAGATKRNWNNHPSSSASSTSGGRGPEAPGHRSRRDTGTPDPNPDQPRASHDRAALWHLRSSGSAAIRAPGDMRSYRRDMAPGEYPSHRQPCDELCRGRAPPRPWFVHWLGCKRASNSADSSIGSAWRCTTFHSSFSRRKIVVLRSMYGVGSDPPIDAVVRSMASR